MAERLELWKETSRGFERVEAAGKFVCSRGGIPICPRCKQPVKAFIIKKRGGREYVYAYHKRGKECYLGAAGKYRYVEGLLNLDLTGLTFADYIEIMRRAFDRALDAAFRNPKLLEELKAELRRMQLETQPEILVKQLQANLPAATAEARA